MSTAKRTYPRPNVVTLACVFIGVTAFLTLTDLIGALMNWGTVDMQKALQPALRELGRNGMTTTMPQLLAVLRWVGLAMIPFVVATMVFSVYAIRGDRTARVFTTVFGVGAGIVSLSLGVFGVLQAVMLFLAAGALWSPVASRWWRDEPEMGASPTVEPDGSGPWSFDAAHPVDTTVSPAPLPETVGPPVASAPPLPPGTAAGQPVVPRPASILTAGLVTILGSIAAAGFSLMFLAVYTFARADYIKAIETGPFRRMVTPDEIELIMQVTFWVSLCLLPVALGGIVGATALLARRRIGRAVTLAWAWTSAAIGLLMFPVGLLATFGAGAVIVLLLRDDARAWTGPSHQ